MRHHPPLVLVTALLLSWWSLPLVSSTPSAHIQARWAGEMRLPNSHAPLPLVLVLTEADGHLAGTGGPNDETQYPLQDVGFDGRRFHGSLDAPGEDRDTFVLDLDVEGDTMAGKTQLRNRHGTWQGTAALSRRSTAGTS